MMLKANKPLTTDRGRVIGCGTVRLTVSSTHKTLSLCYFVTERKPLDTDPDDWKGGKYVATCVDLKLDGYGATPDRAIREMREDAIYYLELLLHHYNDSVSALEAGIKQELRDDHYTELRNIYDAIQSCTSDTEGVFTKTAITSIKTPKITQPLRKPKLVAQLEEV